MVCGFPNVVTFQEFVKGILHDIVRSQKTTKVKFVIIGVVANLDSNIISSHILHISRSNRCPEVKLILIFKLISLENLCSFVARTNRISIWHIQSTVIFPNLPLALHHTFFLRISLCVLSTEESIPIFTNKLTDPWVRVRKLLAEQGLLQWNPLCF